MKTKKILTYVFKTVCAIAFWLVVWMLVSYRINSEFLFPTPERVWRELLIIVPTKEFWLITLTSLLRIIWGILVSLIIGTLLAYLLYVSRILDTLLSPALSAVKATPIASFIILALLWMERDILPVFITALIVVPIVFANVSEGIRGVDKNLVEVAKIYRFSMPKKLFKLYVPSVSPYFLAACRSSLGMAWKAGIAAEILSTPDNSIGRELYYAKTYLETPSLFAWSLVVIFLSLVIEKLFVYAIECMGRRLRMIPKGEGNAEA